MLNVYVSVVQLVFLGILTAGAHWIVGRSKIAKPLWSRASGWLGALLACAGCSGFWLGIALGAVGVRPLCIGGGGVVGTIATIIVTGILGTWVTPVFEAVLLWGLRESAIAELLPSEDPAGDGQGPQT